VSKPTTDRYTAQSGSGRAAATCCCRRWWLWEFRRDAPPRCAGGEDVKSYQDAADANTEATDLPTLGAVSRATDVAVDATYQYTPEGPGAILVNASLIHEKQQLNATFNAEGCTESSRLAMPRAGRKIT
jgi:hypothetical protein